MSKEPTVFVHPRTTTDPITCIGEFSGVCWQAGTKPEAFYRRGLECINVNHGRTIEFPTVYLVFDGWSAKVIRELYTHIGGMPTRLQESTRYIDYSKGLNVVTPPSIENNDEAKKVWFEFVDAVAPTIEKLKELGIPNEDATNVLPLAYCTKITLKTNPRMLRDMSRQRLCSRAYWEFRKMFKEILWQLENYSEEWEDIIYDTKLFCPKCEELGYCPEKKGCGKMKKES